MRHDMGSPYRFSPHHGFYEFEAVAVHIFWIGEEIAPDFGGGCEVGQRPAEGLDGQPSVVVCLFNGLEDGVPVDVSCTGGAAVVFADVDVFNDIDIVGDGSGGVLLFDVGVEGIEHGEEVGMVDAADVIGGVGHGGQEVTLEAIEVFDG